MLAIHEFSLIQLLDSLFKSFIPGPDFTIGRKHLVEEFFGIVVFESKLHNGESLVSFLFCRTRYGQITNLAKLSVEIYQNR
jgi:hypothetical protein